jgi:hypothetical protein
LADAGWLRLGIVNSLCPNCVATQKKQSHPAG